MVLCVVLLVLLVALLPSCCLADGAKQNDPCLVCGQLVCLTAHAPLPRLWWPISCDRTKLSRVNKVVQTPYSLPTYGRKENYVWGHNYIYGHTVEILFQLAVCDPFQGCAWEET